tara:strand:- start:4354 stop:4590 length:237 start_codon:yes stop_codon:yes gene_type:complete
MKKVTEEELAQIKNHRNKINDLMHEIGVLEANKHAALHEVAKINSEINESKKILEEKYGSINIDVNDGTYTLIEEENV